MTEHYEQGPQYEQGPYDPGQQAEWVQQPAYVPDIRVRFGPGPDQLMPLAWAEKILTLLRAEQPRRFTALLGRAVLDGQDADADQEQG